MAKKYQTLSEFVLRPFGKASDVNKDATYGKKYTELTRQGQIQLVAVANVESSYYFHIKIPSESQKNKNYKYDVVIRFFTVDLVMLDHPDLIGYYIQFFSNSPSFIYKYAYVYKQNGFLIEDLFEKLDGDYEDIPPTKTNPNQVMSYDKSIYCAARYLHETRFRNLTKKGVLLSKLIRPEKFFRDIADFQAIRFDQSIIAEEKKLKRELENDKQHGTVRHSTVTVNKKTAGRTTLRDQAQASITVIRKKNGRSKVIAKRKAGRRTFR